MSELKENLVQTTARAERITEEHVDLASLRLLNESAIHAHALECSKQYRAKKFTRVGADFIDEVKADVEMWIRELRNKCSSTVHPPIEPGETVFVTGVLMDRVKDEFNRAIARLIQNKVQRHPTVGKTLGRTR